MGGLQRERPSPAATLLVELLLLDMRLTDGLWGTLVDRSTDRTSMTDVPHFMLAPSLAPVFNRISPRKSRLTALLRLDQSEPRGLLDMRWLYHSEFPPTLSVLPTPPMAMVLTRRADSSCPSISSTAGPRSLSEKHTFYTPVLYLTPPSWLPSAKRIENAGGFGAGCPIALGNLGSAPCLFHAASMEVLLTKGDSKATLDSSALPLPPDTALSSNAMRLDFGLHLSSFWRWVARYVVSSCTMVLPTSIVVFLSLRASLSPQHLWMRKEGCGLSSVPLHALVSFRLFLADRELAPASAPLRVVFFLFFPTRYVLLSSSVYIDESTLRSLSQTLWIAVDACEVNVLRKGQQTHLAPLSRAIGSVPSTPARSLRSIDMFDVVNLAESRFGSRIYSFLGGALSSTPLV
ncbi:hypothetical protein NMY22_g22 [Coprinellus aureogranulatus]|nr:hypothetical protein NMY22_g22 [Coprinellus aureogranulatus]